MVKQTLKGVYRQTCLLIAASLVGLAALLFSLTPGSNVSAAASTNLNFQARLQSSAGAIVPDGNYSIEFKIYSVSSGGTALWTETQATTRVVNGYLSVQLGSVTAFPSTINWDQEHWLTMNVNADGEMNPRLKLTAVPYAFQAGTLAKTDGANRGTLKFNTVANNPNLFLPDEASGTLCIQGSANCGFAAGNGVAFLQGGNTVAANTDLGLNSNFDLNIRTNSLNRLTVQADGDLAVDTDTLFVDAANNRVGVGTGNPASARLVLQGATSDNTAAALNVVNSGGSTSLLYVRNDGRVGIGTTSPGSRLQIGDATVSSDNKLIFGKTATTSEAALPYIQHGSILVAGTGNDLVFGADSLSGGIVFQTDNGLGTQVNRVVIDKDGKVGVGLTNPSEKLQVQGNIRAENSANPAFIVNNSGGKSAALTAGTASTAFLYDNTGSFSIQRRTSAQVLAGSPDVANAVLVADGAGALSFNGATSITGSNTLTVGTGATSLGGTLSVTGLGTFNGGLTVATGRTFTNASSTLLTAIAIADKATGGDIGTAATTVDVATTFTVNQTTVGQSITIPAPTVTTAGRLIYISNIGTASFNLLGFTLSPGTSAALVWNGTAWTATGADGSSILNQKNTDQNANFRISGTGQANTSFISPLFKTADSSGGSNTANITLQSGDANSGNNNTSGAVIIKSGDGVNGSNGSSGNITIDAGAKAGAGTAGSISLGGTNASALTLGRAGLNVSLPGTINTNTFTASSLQFGAASAAAIQSAASQALNITGNAASTFSTSAGNLTLQAGSGTVSLGTSTILTASGALTLGTGSGDLTIDPAANLKVIGSTSDSTAAALNVVNSGGATSLFYVRNDGNVGIGTTSPGQALTVNGNARLSGTSRFLSFDSSDQNFIRHVDTNVLQFATAGAEKVRIDSTGNVGIGTTSPNQKLTVNQGNISLLVPTSGSQAILGYEGTETNPHLGINFNYAGTGATNNLQIADYSGGTASPLVTFQRDGNVGIGTASPVSGIKLDVNGAIQASGADFQTGLRLQGTTAGSTLSPNLVFRDNQATPQQLVLRKGGTQLSLLDTAGNSDIRFGTDGSDTYFNGGNVAIGTTAAAGLLDITGDGATVYLQPATIAVDGQVKSSPTLRLRSRYDSDTTTGIATANLNFDLQNIITAGGAAPAGRLAVTATGTCEVLSILSNGNVGIGDTSPAALFTVGNGDLFQVSGNDFRLLENGTSPSFYGIFDVGDLSANQTFTFTQGGLVCTDSGNCNGAGASLQTAYNNSIGGTTPEIRLDSTRTALDIQDADTTLGASTNLLAVRASNASGLGNLLFGVQASGAATLSGNLSIQGSNSLTLGTASANTGGIVFQNAGNSNTLTLQSGTTITPGLTFTLPTADGSASHCLKTNGAGVLSFADCLGGGGGSVNSLNTLTGDLTIAGTLNQVNVASGGTSITLSLPQDINTTSSPTFAGQNLNVTNTNQSLITSSLTAGARSTYAQIISQANDATNNNSVGLLQLNNQDTGSIAAVLNITQAATSGTGISFTGLTGGSSITVANTSGTALTANTVTTGTALSATGLSSGNGLNLGGTGFTTGNGLLFNTTSNGVTTGNAIDITGAAAGITADLSGSYINVSPTRTLAAAATRTDSASFLNLTRSNTVNNSSGVYNLTGALANLQSNCTVTLGTCNDSANILNLNQLNAGATGTVLNLTNNGTGLALRVNDDGTTTDATPFVIDSAGSVGIGATGPAAKLHVLSTTEQLRLGYDASNYSSFTTLASGALSIGATGTNGAIRFQPSSGQIYAGDNSINNYFELHNSTNVTAIALHSNGNTYFNGGNLGIGTASPTSARAVIQGATSDATAAALSVTDSGGNSKLYVRNDGSVGIGTTSPEATLHVAGTALFKNTADSTAAFQIQNAAASSLFVADTTNNRIQIGSATADGTGVLLVLDTKNTAGDPTGVNGASYYNSNANKFRCYQNGVWQDCLPAIDTSVTLIAELTTWTDQPNAESEWDGKVFRSWADLTAAQQFRLVITMDTAGASGADCRPQYATSNSGPWANLDGSTGPEIAIDTVGSLKTTWTTLAPGAKTDVILRTLCKQGNGSADPKITMFNLQFR